MFDTFFYGCLGYTIINVMLFVIFYCIFRRNLKDCPESEFDILYLSFAIFGIFIVIIYPIIRYIKALNKTLDERTKKIS